MRAAKQMCAFAMRLKFAFLALHAKTLSWTAKPAVLIQPAGNSFNSTQASGTCFTNQTPMMHRHCTSEKVLAAVDLQISACLIVKGAVMSILFSEAAYCRAGAL